MGIRDVLSRAFENHHTARSAFSSVVHIIGNHPLRYDRVADYVNASISTTDEPRSVSVRRELHTPFHSLRSNDSATEYLFPPLCVAAAKVRKAVDLCTPLPVPRQQSTAAAGRAKTVSKSRRRVPARPPYNKTSFW